MKARSVLRSVDKKVPSLTTQWSRIEGEKYTIIDSHIEEYPLFHLFNKAHFIRHMLPKKGISLGKTTISHKTLSDLCENLLQEVYAKKRTFKDFTVLQRKNFSRKHKCGLLVVKFKEYPFVVKLFMENPKSIVNYWWKGFEPIFFWHMGHGAGRFFTGFPRIRNREEIVRRIQANPFKDIAIHIPRKWFWEPKNNPYIKITGNSIGGKVKIETEVPSVYAIIADAIDLSAETNTISSHQKHNLAMALCNHLGFIIDPHTTNYVFTKDPNLEKLQITIIDTEYCPAMVGLKKKRYFESHFEWYTYLVGKCIKDIFGKNKEERELAYLEKNEFIFKY